MHIGCTSHDWQTDRIHSQSINGYQWWLISSLIAVDWKTDQLIDNLSIIWAVVWSIDRSVGHAAAQLGVWAVVQATVYQVVDTVSDMAILNDTDCCVFSLLSLRWFVCSTSLLNVWPSLLIVCSSSAALHRLSYIVTYILFLLFFLNIRAYVETYYEN